MSETIARLDKMDIDLLVEADRTVAAFLALAEMLESEISGTVAAELPEEDSLVICIDTVRRHDASVPSK